MKKIIFSLIGFSMCNIMIAQNVGIGTSSPGFKGKLVIRGTGGAASAVSALFGDTTSGVAIENNNPGIAFNSFFNGARQPIVNGFGGVAGMNPSNGDFHIYTSPAAGTAGNILPTSLRFLINKDGNIGLQAVSNPVSPLSFANSVGNKITLWGNDATSHYGLGIQGGVMQLYTPTAGSDIVFGIGSSTNFTENMRITGDGIVGIGTSQPDASAALQIQSNNKGFLIPRMNTGQRNNISAPAAGLLVFDTDKSCIYMFDGIEWLPLSAGQTSNLITTRTSNTPVINTGVGHAVCINGNYAVVSSRKQQGNGVDTAFVFIKSPAGWIIQAKLVASNGAAGDNFGAAVAISNDQILIGAPDKPGGGAVYAYVRSGDVWTQTAIISPNAPSNDRFGACITMEGLYALIGDPWYLINGNHKGTVYAYYRTGTGWQQLQQLFGSQNHTTFGYDLDISGTYALIGAPDLLGTSDGLAFSYTRSGLFWNILDTIYQDNNSSYDFGHSVTLSAAEGFAFIGGGSVVEGYKINANGFTWSINLTDPSFSKPALSIYNDLLVVGGTEDGTGSEARGKVIVYKHDESNALTPWFEWAPWKAIKDHDNLHSYSPNDKIGKAIYINGFNLIIGNPGFNQRKGKVMFVNLE